MSEETKLHTLRYVFTFQDGSQKDFTVNLDAETLRLVTTPREFAYPAWTEMENFQCAHCPLDKNDYKHCPVAINIVDLIDYFRDFISHTDVHIAIETPERSYAKNSTAQSGVSSLLGIYMVTTGCPIMEQLKPMVRHHLPFATLEETKYRAMSMYLLAQYFRHKAGLDADLELKGLVQIYDDIHTINVNFAEKLTALKVKDASLNAISILDSFADFTTFAIDYEMQDEMRDLFKAYLPAEKT